MAIFMFVLIFYHRQALSLDEEEEEELPDVFNTPPKKPSILSEFVRRMSGSSSRSSGRSGGIVAALTLKCIMNHVHDYSSWKWHNSFHS